MRFLKAAIFCLVVAGFTVSTVTADQYYIKVIPTVVKGFKVEAQIETNLPGSMYLNARLYLKDQKSQGQYVGTGATRVPLSGGKATLTIDGAKKAIPHGYKLPDGKYEIEVVFSHLWPRNTEVTRLTGVKANIKGVATVELKEQERRGRTSATTEASSGTRWVMENVYKGYSWDRAFWQNKFGEIVELEYLGTGDANILAVYYVRSINMSLLVDLRKNLILKYSIGVNQE